MPSIDDAVQAAAWEAVRAANARLEAELAKALRLTAPDRWPLIHLVYQLRHDGGLPRGSTGLTGAADRTIACWIPSKAPPTVCERCDGRGWYPASAVGTPAWPTAREDGGLALNCSACEGTGQRRLNVARIMEVLDGVG